MTTLEVMTVEVIKRGSNMNYYFVAPIRGLIIYHLPRSADSKFDKIQLDDRIECLVDTTHNVVLSVCRETRK